METKLTFKEYYESKEKLLQASKNCPKIITEYIVKKYCRIPILDGKNNKDYISLKPKDVLNILWEFNDIKNPCVKNIKFENKNYLPYWNNAKIQMWIETTTLEKGN